ncbi:MAG: tetratricopeptide repeat protein [Saprospiraceae bacterium]
MNRYFFLLFFLICSIGVQAQTLSAYEDAAREAYEDEAYSNALMYYEKALEIDSDKIENHYMIAEVARLLHAYEMAEKYYLNVAAHEDWAKYPHADFLLASVKKNLGKYPEAADLFQRFIDNANLDIISNEFIRDAKREVANCRIAPQVVEDTLDYITTTNLTYLNTINSEVAPLEQAGQVYYSSLRFQDSLDAYEPDQAVLSIYQTDNVEYAGDRLSFINKEVPTANTAFSSDGKTMYYTICQYESIGKYRCEIYKRVKLADDNWGDAIRLPDLINQPGYNTTHPNIGVDEVSGTEWLFFASDRPNGKGGMDIWCSVASTDGSYNSLINVSEVNTYMDEITPFFHSRKQKLYFSTNGQMTNIGGFDILSSQKKGGRWETPINAGVPLNSSYNDTYFTLDETGQVGHFSSNRKGVVHLENRPEFETCCPDIFRADIDLKVDLIVSTFNGLSQLELLGVDVQLVNVATGEVIPMSIEPEGNRSFFTVEIAQNYLLTGTLVQYTSDTLRFETPSTAPDEPIEKELFLNPPIDLTVLVFDEEIGQPLTGATVQIFELPQEVASAKDTNDEGNDFFYNLNFEKQYRIVASKTNYLPAEAIVSTLDLEKIPTQLVEKLVLRRGLVDLPVVLYFDNDRPNPRTLSTTTTKDYQATFEAYYARREEFINRYIRAAGSNDGVEARAEMEAFFEEQVLEGFNKLEIVSESLLDYLQNGNSIEIVLRGFASPLSNPVYNDNLTKRRIVCIKNHFRSYRDGVFSEYLDNNQLTLTDDPLGEGQAPTGIASEYDDPNSIYGIRASIERRVEIQEVRRTGLSYQSTTSPENSVDKK